MVTYLHRLMQLGLRVPGLAFCADAPIEDLRVDRFSKTKPKNGFPLPENFTPKVKRKPSIWCFDFEMVDVSHHSERFMRVLQHCTGSVTKVHLKRR